MTRVIVDDTLRSKLHGFAQPLEFCDEAGRVIGRFTPLVVAAPRTDRLEPQFSEEELQRGEQEADYSTAEVLSHLENL